MSILDQAEELTSFDRNDVYGHPADDFARTAAIATAMGFTRNGKPLEALDVAQFQICVKLSRWSHSPRHRDTLIDIAGYARAAEMVMTQEIEDAR